MYTCVCVVVMLSFQLFRPLVRTHVCVCCSNAQFPALPSSPARKSVANGVSVRPAAVKTSKTQKEEVTDFSAAESVAVAMVTHTLKNTTSTAPSLPFIYPNPCRSHYYVTHSKY